MSKTSAVFVIPAFNEEAVIYKTIEPIVNAGYKVVCVDDASKDKTSFYARKAGAIVVRHLINAGQGASLQTGFDYIRQSSSEFEDTDFVVTFDADGQHSLKDIEGFMEVFISVPDLDIALGSRFLSSTFKGSRLKSLVLKTMASISKYTMGIKLTDRHNGFRVIRKSSLARFEIISPGYEHADEFIHLIAKHKLKYVEVATDIIYTEYSKAKGQPIINGLKILFDRFLSGWK